MQYSTISTPRKATAAGIGLLAVIGAVHLLYAHGYFLFVAYVGVLFYAAAGGAVFVAVGLLCGARVWGWMFGVLLAAAAIVAYVVSRTIGLPMFPVLPWQDPFGWVSLAAETLFIVLGLIVLRTATAAGNGKRSGTRTKLQRIDKHHASLN
jgi:hypothetical protein